MSTNRKQRRIGLTLIELMVVIAVLGTLTLAQAPAVQKIRGAAAKQQTANHLKMVGLALHNHQDTYKRLPPAWGPFPPPPQGVQVTGPSATFHYWLLPFEEADNVYKLAQPAVAGERAQVWALPKVYSQVIPTYVSPQDATTSDGTVKLSGETPWGAGNMAANARVFGGLKANATDAAWDAKSRIPASFPDGTSNTIVSATRYASCGDPPGGSAWAGGNTTPSFEHFIASGAFFGSDIEDTPLTPAGYATNPPFQAAPDQKGGKNPCKTLFAHAYTADGIQVGIADGSVRVVSPRISSKTWGQACHPSDGNPLGADW
jgi:type II secretory pathway pseudopilin PulG